MSTLGAGSGLGSGAATRLRLVWQERMTCMQMAGLASCSKLARSGEPGLPEKAATNLSTMSQGTSALASVRRSNFSRKILKNTSASARSAAFLDSSSSALRANLPQAMADTR